jgi:glutathione S-transferase
MKLYFFPGACSLSPHIALREAGFKFDLEKVDLKAKKTAGGEDYLAVNPKGYVPALRLDDGQVLTEAANIVQYIADRKPEAKLAPAAGTPQRYKLQEWLNFLATEVHKGTSPLFNPATPDSWKEVVKENLGKRYEFVAKHLAKQPYLMGETFSVADGYLFTLLNWTKFVNIDLGKWPALKAYYDRVAARPAVQEALAAEGLVKKAAA